MSLKDTLNSLKNSQISSYSLEGKIPSPQQQWISVKEELPEPDIPVFVLYSKKDDNDIQYNIEDNITIVKRKKTKKRLIWNRMNHMVWKSIDKDISIDYWLPIPQLPRSE